MKTLERQFFKFCCRNIDHNCTDITKLTFRKMDLEDRPIPVNAIELYKSENQEQNYSFADLIEKYVRINPKVSKKQLCHYIEKWEKYGFINSGVSTYHGWFDFSKLPFRYFQIIPDRLFFRCEAFKTENLYVLLNNDQITEIRYYISKSMVLKELRRK